MEETVLGCRFKHDTCELAAHSRHCLTSIQETHVSCLSVQIPANLQYVYQPTPAWSQYKKGAPVFLNTVCAPPAAHSPPQQVFGYYILPQPSPQFILPQASLQPWGSVKG